jgi:hypothetical protein
VTVLSFFCLAQKKETKKNAPPDALPLQTGLLSLKK